MDIGALSPTKLKQARLCRARLKAKYAKDGEYEEEQGDLAKVGTLAHEAAKVWYRGEVYENAEGKLVTGALQPDWTVVRINTIDEAFKTAIQLCHAVLDYDGLPNGQVPNNPRLLEEARTMFEQIAAFYPREKVKVAFVERKYKGTLPNGVHVSLIIDLGLDIGQGKLEIIDYKGLPLDTPLPTPSGWTTMGDVKVGDKMFDIAGKVCSVIGKSTASEKKCMTLIFDDTDQVTCDVDHRWKLSDGQVVVSSDLNVGDSIDVPGPLDCPEVDLPIDPYVLGCWLGNGKHCSGEITSPDDFVWEEIKRRGFSVSDYNGDPLKCRTSTASGLITLLKQEGLLKNKHVPDQYFRSSYSQRLDLLRGLMDSDGSVNELRKSTVFSNCDENLSEQVRSLALTLGQRAHKGEAAFNGFGKTGTCYPVCFRPIGINPFLLPRKANKVDPSWGPGRSDVRRIVSIEEAPTQITQCIKVDSPDSTYLCTHNLIPTHNTGYITLNDDEMKEEDQVLMNLLATSRDPELSAFQTKQFRYFWVRDGYQSKPHSLDADRLADYEMWLALEWQSILDDNNPKEEINRFCSSCGRRKECQKYATYLGEAYGGLTLPTPDGLANVLTVAAEKVSLPVLQSDGTISKLDSQPISNLLIEALYETYGKVKEWTAEELITLTDDDIMARFDRLGTQLKLIEKNKDILGDYLKRKMDILQARELEGEKLKAGKVSHMRSTPDSKVILDLCSQYGVNPADIFNPIASRVDTAFSQYPEAILLIRNTSNKMPTAPWVKVSALSPKKKATKRTKKAEAVVTAATQASAEMRANQF